MESGADQCRKEGCRGCESCVSPRASVGYIRSQETPSIRDFSIEEIKKELQRRREERRKTLRNAAKLNKIKTLESEIAKIKADLE